MSGVAQTSPTAISVLLSVTPSGKCKRKSLSSGAIAGIAVGAVVALVALLIVVVAVGVARKASWATWLRRAKKPLVAHESGVYQ